jgi:hypothetical protein
MTEICTRKKATKVPIDVISPRIPRGKTAANNAQTTPK